MKKIFSIIALLLSVTAFAQIPSLPAPNTAPSAYEQVGQMLNLSSTVRYEVLDTITTSSSTVTLYLATANYSFITGLPVLYPVIGTGTISFVISGLKISGTLSGNATVQGSDDGVRWAQIRNNTLVSGDTLTIGSGTAAQTYSWDFSSKRYRYYRLAIVIPTGTQQSSWSAVYFLNKEFIYNR
jgi:hypothetical protein